MSLAQYGYSGRSKALTLFLLFAWAMGGFSLPIARGTNLGRPVARAATRQPILRAGSGRSTIAKPVSAPPCAAVSISNTITTKRNVSVTAPITVTDLTGLGVLSFDFNLTYDPAVLTAPVVSNAGTLSSLMVITINPNTPGLLRVSGYYQDFLAGSGVLLNISFTAVGPIGSGSDLTLSPFILNEGNPCSTVASGHVTIVSGTIAGAITYVNAQTPPVPVPNVVLSAAGSVPTSTNSDFSGLYSFGGFGSGPYTVTPSKSGDVNGITGFDSALIAQHIVLLITLSATQLLAADVSQNGMVTSFDAALIAQYVVAIPNVGNTGSWIFLPANRAYADVESDLSAQNYDAILMGEVSGNWIAPTMRAAPVSPSAASLEVSAPDIAGRSGQSLTVPVSCGDTSGRKIFAYQFDLVYDPSVIVPETDSVSTVDTISEGMLATFNPIRPGRLKVVLFAGTPRSGKGTLLNLKFSAVGPPGATSPLNLVDFTWDEGDPIAVPNNGTVRLLSATFATGTVRGRVLSAAGRPVPYARMTLTGPGGDIQTIITNGFGVFEFTNLTAGQNYTLAADGRQITLAPRVLAIASGITELELIADP